MSSLRPVVWLTTAWCLSACPAPADINSATTADTSAANRAIDELQAHVASACECSETSCMARALERIDKHVDKHTKASVSAAQVRRVKAQLEHLETCVRDARAKTDRLDGLAAAVAARCACTADDAGCATRAEEGFRVALESATALALKTHEQVVKRSLQFEFMECQARTLPGPPGASSRSRVRGRLARWQDLPRSIDASKHFQQMAMRLGLSFIDELWDLSPEDIFRAFPRSESGEFNDLEPWGSRIRLRLGNVDLRGINLVLEWRFMEGRLFMIVAEMKRTSRRLPEQTEAVMKRKPDTQHTEDWRMKVRTWFDGDLAIRATIDGKANDFALAHRPALLTYLERRKTGQKALTLNRKALQRLRTRPFSSGYARGTELLISALRAFPKYGHARVNLCRALLFQGRTTDAVTHCEKSKRSKNRSASAESIFYLGMAASRRRSYGNAKKLFQAAASREANDASIAKGAARWLRFLNRKATTRDLKYVAKEIACARADNDQPRAILLATNAGFDSPEAFMDRASKRVDVAKYTSWAAKRCASEP